ncbi:MAG: hypothetical protein RL702_1962 [Pseudomonadota bacterium]|jgi:hypothetical protein
MTLLHDLPDFGDLIEVTARSHAIDPGLVEKDYWIMHGIWGLQQLGFRFELKGGTSLSKGFRLIHRFSEDIDILIHPDGALPTGKNQNKLIHVDARRAFYDSLPARLHIPGFVKAERDRNFDDERMRSAGIRLLYPAISPLPGGVKAGILLEAGFDQVAPNRPCLISSWAYDAAMESGLTDVTDNRAIDVPCYEPGYTFVESSRRYPPSSVGTLKPVKCRQTSYVTTMMFTACWRILACRRSSALMPMSRTRRHGFPLPTNR